MSNYEWIYPLVGEFTHRRQDAPKLSAKVLVVHFGSTGTSAFIRNNDTAMSAT